MAEKSLEGDVNRQDDLHGMSGVVRLLNLSRDGRVDVRDSVRQLDRYCDRPKVRLRRILVALADTLFSP